MEKTMIVFGSPMADGNIHNHRRAPLIVLGHANGRLEGNLHLKAPDGTPMANAMLSMLHTLGHDDMESFGDSTGELPLTMPTSASPDREGEPWASPFSAPIRGWPSRPPSPAWRRKIVPKYTNWPPARCSRACSDESTRA